MDPSLFYNKTAELDRCNITLAASGENRSSGFLTWSDTNRAVQPQKMARGLKFGI